jgi:hypothetical protein
MDGEPEQSIYPPGSHRTTETSVGDRFLGKLQNLDADDEYGRQLDSVSVTEVVDRGIGSKSELDYWRAVHALRRRGTQEVFDAVVPLAAAEESRSRRLAADVIAQLGAKDGDCPFESDATPHLLPLLGDPDGSVQAAAAHPFANHESPDAVPGLLRLARSPTVDARLGAVFGLHGHLTYPGQDEYVLRRDVADALVDLARDADREVRDWSVFWLAICYDDEVRDEAIIHVLRERALDPDNEIRVEAINGLAHWEPAEALPLLQAEPERELAEGNYWMDAFEGAERIADRSLLPVLERIVEDMSEEREDFEGYWLDSVREAIAACSGSTAEPEGAKA